MDLINTVWSKFNPRFHDHNVLKQKKRNQNESVPNENGSVNKLAKTKRFIKILSNF